MQPDAVSAGSEMCQVKAMKNVFLQVQFLPCLFFILTFGPFVFFLFLSCLLSLFLFSYHATIQVADLRCDVSSCDAVSCDVKGVEG